MPRKDDRPDAQPFNPLDKHSLGQNVAERLLRQDAVPLGGLPQFFGAGIYALYYAGHYPPYARLAATFQTPQELPIYVGKAVPKGSRKGASITGSVRSTALFERLKEHEESIHSVFDLRIEDFFCRYLCVDDIWIPLGEAMLIHWFKPLWNQIGGFGIHDPGVRRREQRRSNWDVLHPGRDFAEKQGENPKTVKDIEADVARFLDNYFSSTEEQRLP